MGITMPQGMGCALVDIRDWPGYNEHLVRRGEALLDLSVLEGWDEELERMNRGKRGRPFAFPERFFWLLSGLKAVFQAPFRCLEGMFRVIMEQFRRRWPDYTTVYRRWSRLEEASAPPPREAEGGEARILAVDSTGIKVSSRGEWMREKWHVHRGWLKLHVAVDVATCEILSWKVTEESEGDALALPELVRQATARSPAFRLLADGAYDNRENFDLLRREGIEAGIKLRRNATRRLKGGSFARPSAVAERQRLGEEGWKVRYGYGMRWKVETTFSAFKRMLGEGVRARKRENMLKEVRLKVITYNKLKAA